MLGKSRRRTDRGGRVRASFRVSRVLENLETRSLMTYTPNFPFYGVQHTTKLPRNVNLHTPPVNLQHPYGTNPHVLAKLQGDGKCLTGKDRQGDEWMITVHGPGVAIVTDASPGDGVFDDDIDTITIVGSDPNRTYVYATTSASARVLTDGVVRFNRLVALNGAHSIILNGFTLASTVQPQVAGQANNVGPEIYIPGGVRLLKFHDIEATINTVGSDNLPGDQPFEIVIGEQNTPLRVRPSIQLDSIFNTVLDPTATSQAGFGPQIDASVNFIVNGDIQSFEALSVTAAPVSGGLQFNFPTVDITGRTAVRGLSMQRLKVVGSARNLVVARAGNAFQPQNGQPSTEEQPVPPSAPATTPFRSPFSGMRRLGKATFGGVADGVGLDVQGPIGSLTFARGLGDPSGVPLNATEFGFNSAAAGYPSRGLQGGLIRASRIHSITAAPANLTFATPTDPDLMQLRRQGSTTLYARPGSAFTNAAIVTEGSIDHVNVVGNARASQISTGFDYTSYVNGLDPTRSPSQIRRLRLKGDLIDSVVSASYRPGPDGIYGTDDDRPQRGAITGKQEGRIFDTGVQTALNFRGTGFFARTKNGYLPPPERRQRNHLSELLPGPEHLRNG